MTRVYGKKGAQGFTLIELMIVVVILGIVVAIAVPAYQMYVTKGRRQDGKAKVMEVAQRLERYYSERLTYTTSPTDLGYTNPLKSDQGFYTLTIAANDGSTIASSFKITAAPQGVQSTRDTACGSLIMTSENVRSTSTSATNCW